MEMGRIRLEFLTSVVIPRAIFPPLLLGFRCFFGLGFGRHRVCPMLRVMQVEMLTVDK